MKLNLPSCRVAHEPIQSGTFLKCVITCTCEKLLRPAFLRSPTYLVSFATLMMEARRDILPAVCLAAAKGNIKEAKSILHTEGISQVLEQDQNGWTALFHAAVANKLSTFFTSKVSLSNYPFLYLQ